MTHRHMRWAPWVSLLAVLGAPGLARVDYEGERPVYLRVGDKAPAFQCRDDQGNVWKSSQHAGKKVVVLYFYLGDFMKDCTTQAWNFRKYIGDFRRTGAEVVGASGDEVGNHRLFKETYELPYTLLADENGAVAKQFGVSLSGGGVYRIKDSQGGVISLRRGVTASRWVFVIDTEGRVIYKNTNVNAKDEWKKILTFLEKRKEKKEDD